MNLGRGYRTNNVQKIRQIKGRPAIGLNPDPVLIFKQPGSRGLGIISRSLFLALFILALPSIGSLVRDAFEEHSHDFLPMTFNDLVVEGLYKDGCKGLLLSSGIGDLFESLWFLNDKEIDLVTDSDSDRHMVKIDCEEI